MSSPDPRDAIAEVAGIVGVGAERGGGIDAAVDAALDVLVAATGAAAVALFSGAPRIRPGCRCARVAARQARRRRSPARSAPRRRPGWRGPAPGGGGRRVGAADDLSALGVPGGVIVPARLDGRTVGALALLPRDRAGRGGPTSRRAAPRRR